MSDRPLRIVFAGTPEFAAAHLRALLDWPGGEVVAVYTMPDEPAGRGKKLTASPVKQLAEQRGLPVYQPTTLRNDAAQAELRDLAADVLVVVAYGLILPQAVLDTPRLGCINVHGSILPRWRGAAPVQRAIEAGDDESGVTIMQMDAGLDTGAMLRIARCAIGPDDSAGDLFDKLAALGPPALIETLADLAAGRVTPQPQDDRLSCYAAKIDKAEAALDWRRPAAELARRVRAFNPAPVAFATLEGEAVRIYAAAAESGAAEPGSIIAADKKGIVVACGEGALRLLELQLPGGKRMAAAAVLNGRAALFAPGRSFDRG